MMGKVAYFAGVVSVALAGPAAAEFDLPGQIAWTAYDTGSAGYNQAVAIGAALKNAADVNLRILPGKSDVARIAPVRQGRVPISSMGVGVFMLQEGVFEFADPGWGPQPIRAILLNNAETTALAVGVAADEGIESYADLKGKRIVYVKGAPALNVAMEAFLAYGGLGWHDVQRVEFGGYGDSWNGLMNDQVDAAFANTTAGQAYQAASGPRGLSFPEMDPQDSEAWARMEAVAPYFARRTATEGAVVDEVEGGVPSAGYAYPVLATYASTDESLVYNTAKAMIELYDSYAGKAPGIDGWALENQDPTWVIPYHEGAVRLFEEVGIWSEEAQAHNDQLIRRQQVLSEAWAALKNEAPEDWTTAWETRRREALKEAGLPVVF